MRILIVENGFQDLRKSRKPLGNYFQSLGNDVFYACPDSKEKSIHTIPMSRNSLAPIQLINGCKRLINLETENAIEAVLSFRFIPNVLNYLASFHNGSTKRVAVITGLGYAFVSTNNSLKAITQRKLIKLFYRIASKRVQLITQNPDDLVDLGVDNGKFILGSGVKKTNDTFENRLYTDSFNLLYVGRLLRSKGIFTAVEIFEQLQSNTRGVTLTIAGSIDVGNPDSITEAELSELINKKGVNFRGFVNDMDSVYKKCNVLLFPSTYREGVPRVILESLKYGLTIVTSDMPGCKETINDNGFLISRDTDIEGVIEYLSSLDSNKLKENQTKSKELFQSTFSTDVIYPQYLSYLLK
jgi:glycosyltransferase involved in cell wall biosynthesis